MQTTLYYREDSSDKVYHAEIAPKDGGFVVNFAYGRRGSTLSTGTKTQQPVSEAEARKIYDKLVAEKMAKGYTPGEDGTPYAGESAGRVSGLLPQLCNECDEATVQALLRDDAWYAQRKFDGRRMMVRVKDGQVDCINRKGLIVAGPQPIADQLKALGKDMILDGEAVGDRLFVFDLLDDEHLDLRTRIARLEWLKDHACHFCHDVLVAQTAKITVDKLRLYDDLAVAGCEGIVFKRACSLYKPGRPNTGGDWLKFKFYKTLSALVTCVNDQRSVGLGLYANSAWIVNAGNVTIPPNHSVPPVGSVVEVRYLYATEPGILYQPVYLGRRNDIDPEQCLRSQLKYKGQEDDEA